MIEQPVEQRAALQPSGRGRGVAVVVPCFNEASTIGTVIDDFRRELPEAEIHVFDNASTDDTAAVALARGAVVHRVRRKGKGHVVRKMFADVEAEIYVMVDGDATYDAASAPELVELLVRDSLDMVVGARVAADDAGEEYRPGHALGNRVFTWLYRQMFEVDFDDVFSGYRVFTRRFVKSFPATTGGFDIETELIVHAADLQLEVAELPTPYLARPEGSESKLSTYRDGLRILRSAVRLYRDSFPQRFFGGLALIATAIAFALGVPIIDEYVRTGLVPRFPTAIAAAAIQTIGLILLTAGVVTNSVRQVSREQRRLAYLALSNRPPGDPPRGGPGPIRLPDGGA